MLYFVVVWLLLSLLSWVIGTGALNEIRADRLSAPGDRLVSALWLGTLLLAVSLLATSLLLPLSPGVGAGVVLLLCGLAMRSRSTRSELRQTAARLRRSHLWGILAGAIGIAALITKPVTWIDTGLYHYSLIQWLGKFGTVPGLALLLSNLGFSSSWLALAAPLNADVFEARVSAATNGFAFWLLGVQLVVGLIQLRQQNGRLSDQFLVAFSLLMFPIVAGSNLLLVILVSPSPDLPVLLLVGVVAWLLLAVSDESLREGGTSQPSNTTLIPLLLATGAVTIKLTALPLLAVTGLYALWAGKWRVRRLGIVLAVVGGLLAPLFLVGITASGCPLYPSTAFCLNLPWSLPAESAIAAAKSTHAWTSWYQPPPTIHPWLWAVYQWLTGFRPNQLLAALMIVSLGSGVLLWRSCRLDRGQGWVAAIAGGGTVFFMLTSPFFRFMLVYLLLLPILAGLQLWQQARLSERFVLRGGRALEKRRFSIMALGSAALIVALYVKSHSPFQLLLPPRMQASQVIQKQGSDFVYFSPQPNPASTQFLCWDAPIPCGFTIAQQVRLRQPERGFRGGFVWDASSHSSRH